MPEEETTDKASSVEELEEQNQYATCSQEYCC